MWPIEEHQEPTVITLSESLETLLPLETFPTLKLMMSEIISTGHNMDYQ